MGTMPASHACRVAVSMLSGADCASNRATPACLKLIESDDHPNGWLTRAEHGAVVGEIANADEVDEPVESELIDRSRIGDDGIRLCRGSRVDKPRPSTSSPRERAAMAESSAIVSLARIQMVTNQLWQHSKLCSSARTTSVENAFCATLRRTR
jgi:hypothetical protein